MTESLPLPEEKVLLAAEFVLELLDEDDRAGAVALERSDQQFRAEVARWRTITERLVDEQADAPAPMLVWSRIEASLPRTGDDAPMDVETVATSSPAVAQFWRPLAIAASLACIVAIGFTAISMERYSSQAEETARLRLAMEQVAALNVAQISGANGTALMSAAYYPQRGLLKLRLADIATERTAPELWILDESGKPHSLGLITDADDLTIQLSGELRQLLVDGATVAITLEPRTNAPHEAPTGAILGTARLSSL